MDHETRTILSDVERCIDIRPDSALVVLQAIDTAKLSTEGIRAYYSLLHAIALDKNWIDTTDISVVMPAVEYYVHHGKKVDYSKALYYLGCIQYNGHNYSDAIVSFTKAKEYAEGCEDNRYKSLIFQAMGDTYGATYLPEESLWCTDSSIFYCRKATDTTLAFSSVFRKAQILNNLHRHAEADSLYRMLIMNQKRVNPIVFPRILAEYALHLISAKQDYQDAVKYYEEALEMSGKLPSVNHWCAYAFALSAIGNQSKSESLFQQLEQTSARKTYEFQVWKSRYDASKFRYKQAYELLRESSESQTEGMMRVLQQSAVKAQRNYFELEKIKAEESRKMTLRIALVSGLFLLLFFLVIYLLLKRRSEHIKEKNHLLRQENASLQNAVDSLSDQMTEMKFQQAQLQREFTRHLQSSFREWGQLYKAYYHPVAAAAIDIRDNVFFEARNAIAKLSGDKEGQRLLERRLNELFDDVMKHYRVDFPDREEGDYHFVSFVFAGFDATVLKAAFEIPSLPATYERKSRLKETILHSTAQHKDLYLLFFR